MRCWQPVCSEESKLGGWGESIFYIFLISFWVTFKYFYRGSETQKIVCAYFHRHLTIIYRLSSVLQKYYGHSAGSFKYPWPHKLLTASYLYLPAIVHLSATESGSRGASLCQTVRWTLVYWEYLSYSLSAWYGLLTKVTLLHRARRMVHLSLSFRVHVTPVPSSLHMVYRSFIVIIYPTHAIFLTHDFSLFFVHRLLAQSQQSNETIERYVAALQWLIRSFLSINLFLERYFLSRLRYIFSNMWAFIFNSTSFSFSLIIFGPKRRRRAQRCHCLYLVK